MFNRKGREVFAKTAKQNNFNRNPSRPLRKLRALCGFFFFFSYALAQDLNYAHKIIDTLTSPSMHGRGYVNDGDKIAATYITNQFKSFRLSRFGSNYFQEFQLPINTFPFTVSLKIGTQKLIPGKDFIVAASSSSKKGKFKVFYGGKGNLKKFFITRDKSEINRTNCAGVILLKKKLTWDISKDTNICTVELLDTLLPKKIKNITLEIENVFIKDYQTQNVISYIKGSQYPDSFMVFSAHYDHLGQMGKDVYFPGANDNASGCALLLNLAKYYSEHPPKYSIAFMAFGAEEAGLEGSKYYTEHPLFPLKQIKFLVNLDLVGTGEEGVTVVNGSVFKSQFDALTKINNEHNYLPQVKTRGKAANSDHYYFSEKGVKSFFIYTMGGIKAYHDIYDRPETLPLTKFNELFRLLVDFNSSIVLNFE